MQLGAISWPSRLGDRGPDGEIWALLTDRAGAPCSVPDCSLLAAVVAGGYLLCGRHALGCARHAIESGRELDDVAVVAGFMHEAAMKDTASQCSHCAASAGSLTAMPRTAD